ncbi:MAG: T9SS type A sorting domain-containing protein [Crocinitomicaceae bacterium]
MLLKKSKYLLVLFVILLEGFTLNAQQWTQMADFPGEGRHRATAISIGNKGYLGFGHINGTGTETIFNDWWEYDPSNNSWTQKASCPIQSMPFSYYTMLDSKGFVIDGVAYLGSSNNGPFLSYNSFTNMWHELNTPSTGMGFSSPLSFENKGYVYGNNSLEIYNPGTDSWTSFSGFSTPIIPDVGWWQNIHSKGTKMYFTGYNGQYNEHYFWSFDITDSIWTDHGLWLPVAQYPYVFDHQDLIIVACGGSSNPWAYNEVYAFDPNSETWTQMMDFTGSARRYTTGFTIQNQGYLCTGTNGVNMSDLWRMNNILGTEDMNKELSLNVFPNPAMKYINISLEEHTSFKVELFDPSGKGVGTYETTNGKITIERGNLPSGSYHLVVETNNGLRSSGKFLFN